MQIVLHGYLHDLHPHPINVEASSVAEAVSSLKLLPAFKPQFGKRHEVIIDGFGSYDAVYDHTDVSVIHLRPAFEHAMSGAGGGGGMGQIIMGIIIIVVSIFIPPAGAAMLATYGVTTGGLMMAGAMMVLGGILAMLMPQPELKGSGVNSEEQSRYLGTPKNTVAIGTPIPIIVGRRKAYGHYISFNINAGDFNSAPAEWYSSPFTNLGEDSFSSINPVIPMPDPSHNDNQPTSFFTNVTYPGELSEDPQAQINFFPFIELSVGEWDVNFANGVSVHVMNEVNGMTSYVMLLGGDVRDIPETGTAISFTQNYV